MINKYKVFWCSCVPIIDSKKEIYFFETLKQAKAKFKELSERDLKNESINVGVIQKFNNDNKEYEDLDIN